MTIAPFELLFYAGGLFVLFLTPGPVWVALLARAMSGGFNAAWPLALGVVVGDVLWPLIAILGVTWIVDQAAWFMDILKWVAVAMFAVMGILLIQNAEKELSENSRLTRPGMWAGTRSQQAVEKTTVVASYSEQIQIFACQLSAGAPLKRAFFNSVINARCAVRARSDGTNSTPSNRDVANSVRRP